MIIEVSHNFKQMVCSVKKYFPHVIVMNSKQAGAIFIYLKTLGPDALAISHYEDGRFLNKLDLSLFWTYLVINHGDVNTQYSFFFKEEADAVLCKLALL